VSRVTRLEFFEASTGNLLAAEAAAGVGHHIALSVVGTDRLQQSGYFRDALATCTDPRTVASDPHASYFGAELGKRTLLPSAGAAIAETRYRTWPGRTASGK
jgi:hypothetical protein